MVKLTHPSLSLFWHLCPDTVWELRMKLAPNNGPMLVYYQDADGIWRMNEGETVPVEMWGA